MYEFPARATSYPCFYGIDTPSRKELISASHTIEEIARYITADSLCYLSLEGLHAALVQFGNEQVDFCDACFSGNYPVKFSPTERYEPAWIVLKNQSVKFYFLMLFQGESR